MDWKLTNYYQFNNFLRSYLPQFNLFVGFEVYGKEKTMWPCGL